MKTNLKILSLIAVMAVGFGIYAIYQGTGNEAMTENSQQSPTSFAQTLKPFAKGDMAAMRILENPVDLTRLSFSDGEGKSLTISDWHGQTVLLNLWATWCPPCRHEMPFLEDLEKQLGNENFQVVTVSIDLKSPDKPRAFFAETELKALKFYWDGSARIFAELKKENLAFGMPTTVLINSDGEALGVLNGPATWNSKDAIALINQALKSPRH